jgi:hypothetical protein
VRSVPFLTLVVVLVFAPSASSAACGPQSTAAPYKEDQAAEAVLRWVGHAQLPFEEKNAERCNRLVITANGQAQYGKCSQKLRTAKSSFYTNAKRFVRQFASFEYRSSDATLSFSGRGNVEGEVWQRAMATWASYTFAELYGGHACAACRNVLEWSFPLIPNRAGYRGMLIVTHDGYAVKWQGDTDSKMTLRGKIVAEGWLTTEEWTQLENWVQTRFSQGNYDRDPFCRKTQCALAGNGTWEMSPLEFDALREWARKVYDRLQQK